MKKIIDNTEIKQLAVLLLGLMIAVFSVVSPYHQTPDFEKQQVAHHTDQDQTDHDANNDAEGDLIVKTLNAVPHAFQAGSLSDLNGYIVAFVFETPEVAKKKAQNVSRLASKYFRTLFRYIISPNAP